MYTARHRATYPDWSKVRATLSDELVEQLVPLIQHSKSDVVAGFCKRLEQRLAVIEFDRRKLHDHQTREVAGAALAAAIEQLATESTPDVDRDATE